MVEHISERLAFIIKELGFNNNSFSEAIGQKNNTTIYNIINNKRSPSAEISEKILVRFPFINARWWATGQGEPFNEGFDKTSFLLNNNSEPKTAAEPEVNYDKINGFENILKEIKHIHSRIDKLEKDQKK